MEVLRAQVAIGDSLDAVRAARERFWRARFDGSTSG
jgi:hypothetical protein